MRKMGAIINRAHFFVFNAFSEKRATRNSRTADEPSFAGVALDGSRCLRGFARWILRNTEAQLQPQLRFVADDGPLAIHRLRKINEKKPH
jgi:hypothetical protein